MLEFFKKGCNQEIRDFNQAHGRQVSHLKEIGCNLPDLCLAWPYVDKLRLDNVAELNLLSSTGNKHEISKFQDAAVIQDRMNRRLWGPRRSNDKDKKGSHFAHVAGNTVAMEDAEGEISEENDGTRRRRRPMSPTRLQQHEQRGSTNNMSKEDRIKQAKARSYCSACKRRGHATGSQSARCSKRTRALHQLRKCPMSARCCRDC